MIMNIQLPAIMNVLSNQTPIVGVTCRERDRALAQAGAPIIQAQRTDAPRFTGGGFNLKAPKTAA